MKLTFSKLKLVNALFLYILITTIFALPIQAQDDNQTGLSISPVVFELNSDPSDSLTNQIKVYNPTDNPTNVKMLVEDFTPVGEEGQVVLEEPDENTTFSLASWATITPEEFVLRPAEQQVVSFTINVPANAEPGGHYGSIVAYISGGGSETTGSSIGSKRGALVLLRVSGDIKENIIVNTFSTKSFQEKGPVEFDLKFENTGNVHVRPAGFITITDTFGNQVVELEIPQNNVIPDAIRQAGTTWEDTNLIGRYTATLVANYGTGSKQTITSVTNFIVFPWKIGLIIGGIILVLLITLIKSRKRLSKAIKVLIGKS
ncbi:WxL protein peptidoglycan domain-containing protein [Patescibacteria group bacterium]